MRAKAILKETDRREPTLQEEIGMLGDDDLMEFMNLTSRHTGIEGVVFLSTVLGQHGPRVKYYVKAGKGQPSFSVSIGKEPRVLASSLPDRVVNRVAPTVIEWVKINQAALLQFWNEGDSWPIEELSAFADRLHKLPSD